MLDKYGGNFPGADKTGVYDEHSKAKVIAIIHTHGRPMGTVWDSRFSWDYDLHANFTYAYYGGTRDARPSYKGMYLAAPNGTLQFLPAEEHYMDNKDKLVRVVSTETPVVEGALPYTPGSEQVYNRIVKKRSWTYFLNPFHIGEPWEYTVYEYIKY
jgi:hypothetical protein